LLIVEQGTQLESREMMEQALPVTFTKFDMEAAESGIEEQATSTLNDSSN